MNELIKSLRKIQIEYKELHTLIPYADNAKIHPIKQLEGIAESISKYGFLIPILVDVNNVIVAGHARYEAAASLGYNEIPCIVADDLSPNQVDEFRILDNLLAESGHDVTKLHSEIARLNLDLNPFKLELEPLKVDIKSIEGEDEVEEVNNIAEPITKLGDVWILGGHRLICGDSTNPLDIDKLFSNKNPNIMVTDPPYGVNHDPSWRDEYCVGKRGFSDKHANSKGLVTNDNQADWLGAYTLFPGNIAYIWHSARFTALVADNLLDSGFNLICQIIWAKQHFSFGRGDYHWQHEPCWYAVKKDKPHNWCGDRKQTTLWEIASLNPIGQVKENEKEEKTGHSTQKPIQCMLKPILNNSEIGDYVYDPFGGSGTTLIACEKSNRKCLMVEIDPNYCDIIIKRWQKLTNKDAILESTQQKFNELKGESYGT